MTWFLANCTASSICQFKIWVFALSLFLIPSSQQAQNISSDSYKALVHRVSTKKNTTYHYLDSVFFEFYTDTLKMRYLLKTSEKFHFFKGESYALNMLGESYRNLSNYNKSIRLHTKALKKAKQAESIDLEVISLNMLGVAYRKLDVIRTALDYHKEALDLAETIQPSTFSLKHSIAISQNSMGNIYLVLRQYDMALELFKSSLLIDQELNNKLGLAINYHNIGYIQESRGYLDKALINYQTSLKYNNEINSDIGRVICYNSIGKLDIKRGEYKKALPIIKNALKNAKILNDKFYISVSYSNLGLIQLKMQNFKEAKKNLDEALRIAEKYNLKSQESETYSHLSQLEENLGNYKNAFLYYQKYVDLDKALTSVKDFQYVNDLILKYESEKKNNQIKALASENEIVKLKLIQNRRILLLSLIGAVLVIGLFFILQRQRRLKNEKKIITLEQEMLRNQMNPHFIFNSLNSIKLFIINNEKENAVYYLNKFSKLIRKILIASTEKEISLQDELETMSLYMNIENMRFSNEIDYQVHVASDINTTLIKVPSLILQPFLENALWHGLSSKTDNKRIVLEVKQDSKQYVTITITDNGIGRYQAIKIKEKKKIKRKSVGIKITKARLENFSKSYSNDSKIEIEDLYKNNLASGTKVTVYIPVNTWF